MQIRKNTKAYKTILSIIEACNDRPDRSELVRLFLTKAGQTIHDRIYIEGIETNADVFYNMTYQALVINLRAASYQLHASDDLPGIYFLRGSNKTWDETPFEFAEIIAKRFAGLPELPVTRKKEAVQKYALPTLKEIAAATVGKKQKTEKVKLKVNTVVAKQPAFQLKKSIEFTNLEQVVFKQANLNKRDVLDYYNSVSDYLLPWLKDRVLWVRSQTDTPTEHAALNKDTLSSDSSEAIPTWILQRDVSNKPSMLCNDREHLFFYLNRGYLEFSTSHAPIKSFHSPDYMVLVIDSPGSDLTPAIEVAIAIHEVLTGLQLPSFIKTDGQAGFHIYVPIDGKSDYEKINLAAEYICKLIRLKVPNLVTLNAAAEMTYGKVSLNYHLNAEGQHISAPYSVVQGSQPIVATPLKWDEVKQGFSMEDYTINTIVKRLDKNGDPFKSFFKKKVNGEVLLAKLKEYYLFLI